MSDKIGRVSYLPTAMAAADPDDFLSDVVTGWKLLSTTTDASDPAVKLYERSGWRRLGLLSPDAQVMGLRRA